jgi:membrane-bound serine protease (ClpP class)
VETHFEAVAGAALLALSALSHLAPDAAILVLTMGLLLIYVELNRPGWILPGTVGLVAALFAVASLLRLELNPGAMALVGTAVGLLVLDLLRRSPAIVAVAATVALVLGFGQLVVGPGGLRVNWWTALAGGVVLGTGTSILTRIARRARTNKRFRLDGSAF